MHHAAWPTPAGVELLARLARTAGHDDGADVVGLEHPEGRVLEVVGALDELVAEAQVRLVRAEAAHRLGIAHPWERRGQVDTDERPDLLDDRLAELEDVVLGDEGHLDVELGELRLPVGAEVLVAVAARDLVVALHARDHEQLLEELRALRQGVPRARRETRGHEEVASTLGRGPGQRRGLDLDEVALPQHLAGRGVDLGAQPNGVTGVVGAGAAQVEVAVLETRLLADGGALVDLERQRGARAEHLDLARHDVDLTGRDVVVDVLVGPSGDLTGHRDAVLIAQVMRGPGQHLVTGDNLDDAAGVAQVDEGDAPVIAPLGHPTGQSHGGAGVGGTQGAGLMGAEHGESFLCQWVANWTSLRTRPHGIRIGLGPQKTWGTNVCSCIGGRT